MDYNCDTGVASLVFNGLNCADSGKYECVASSTIGKTNSSTEMCVKSE